MSLQPEAIKKIEDQVRQIRGDSVKFAQKVKTADLFMPLISEILREAELPDDFKFLALVDNTQPDSLIFWQMSDKLAPRLGLDVNNQVDERQHITYVSRKVAQYLGKRQELLDNWILTLLSYKLDAQSLKNLPQLIGGTGSQKSISLGGQAHPDIYTFLAAFVSYRHAIGYNPSPQIELITYEEGAGQSLSEIAGLFTLKEDKLKQLNPWLKTEKIPPGKDYEVIIPMPAGSPTSEVNVFTTTRGAYTYQTPNESFIHIVEPGETLYRISRLYGVSVGDISSWNRLGDQNSLHIGQRLYINNPKETESPEEVIDKQTFIHTVSSGETLYRISRKYQVGVEEIKAWNRLNSTHLHIGQKLKINRPTSSVPTPEPNPPSKLPPAKEDPIPDKPINKPPNPGKAPYQGRRIRSKKVPAVMEALGVRLLIDKKAQRLIQKDVDLLLKSEKYFINKLKRVDLYMPLIEETLRKQGLPQDFKYLPIQESALIGNAVSRSKAVGYWQFKKASAQEVGIQVNGSVDERMNIIAATLGACKYMKRSNLYFNNWLFSLLSFNMGFTGAKNYLAQTFPKKRAKNLKEITIDQKTHWYIRKFLAHKVAFESETGQEVLPQKLENYQKGARLTLSQIAEKFSSDAQTIQPYNLWLKKNRVPGDKTYDVIVIKDVY